MQPKRVLFISHDASRSGAPILLLHFLRWFKANVGWPFAVLLVRGGELESEFAALAPTACLPTQAKNFNRAQRMLHAFTARGEEGSIRAKLGGPFDLIYCNTIDTAAGLDFLQPIACPVLCHVHELAFNFQHIVGDAAERVTRQASRFIACAEAVANYLIAERGIAAAMVDVVHEFIPAAATSINRDESRRRVLTELGLPPDALIVGGAGRIGWRKGTDLFVQLVASVRKLCDRPVAFLWIGGGGDHKLSREQVQHDIRLAGLGDRVFFLGPRTDPLTYFAASDLFALTSREDPFPLVCLEAASVGTPTICFDGAGGMPEFVESDAGRVTPMLDVAAMAATIVELLNDAPLRKCLGDRPAEKVRERHDVAAAAQKIFAAMRRAMGEA